MKSQKRSEFEGEVTFIDVGFSTEDIKKWVDFVDVHGFDVIPMIEVSKEELKKAFENPDTIFKEPLPVMGTMSGVLKVEIAERV